MQLKPTNVTQHKSLHNFGNTHLDQKHNPNFQFHNLLKLERSDPLFRKVEII